MPWGDPQGRVWSGMRVIQNGSSSKAMTISSNSTSPAAVPAAGFFNLAEIQGEIDYPLIPGLPDELAILCLARVPRISTLYGVSKAWCRILYSSRFFYSLREELGNIGFNWLYTLVASPVASCESPTHSSCSPSGKQDGGVLASASASSFAFTWYAFDPLAAKWHRLPPMPPGIRFEIARKGFLGPYYSHSIQCCSTDHKLIVVAGTRTAGSSSSKVEPALEKPLVFDVQRGTWGWGPRYAVPRRWCTCGTAQGRLLLLASGCGNEWDEDTAKRAEVWDTAAPVPRWRALPQLASTKFSREATAAVEVDGRLHMVSARVGVVYDPARDGWGQMPAAVARGCNGPCVASRGSLYVMEDTAGRLKAYDPAKETWFTLVADERLKGMANVVAAYGKICGSVRDAIRIVDIGQEEKEEEEEQETTRHHPQHQHQHHAVQFMELSLPVEGQIVAMQILSAMMVIR